MASLTENNEMNLHQIVTKLVGPVDAIGEHNADQKRLANLKTLTELVEMLLLDIHYAARSANNHQDSMKAIGKYAKEFLEENCK